MNPRNEEKKREIYNFINNFIMDEGYSPSYSEIADGVGSSKSTVAKFISRLADEGLIEQSGARITTRAVSMNYQMPVVGIVACGNPVLAVEDIQGYVPLDRSKFSDGEYFGLVAEGYSMVNIGVYPGDILYIRRQDTADDGEVVVAMISDDFGEQCATLKRFYRDIINKRYILRPENNDMDDIVVDNVRIIGVAQGLFRSLS